MCKGEWNSWSEFFDDVKDDYDLEFVVLGTGRDAPELDSLFLG